MKLRIIHSVVAIVSMTAAVSFFCGCGGGGSDTQFEFPQGKSLVISIGPAQSASPVDYEGIPVSLDRAWTLAFQAGAGLTGIVTSNGSATQSCVYSVRGDVNNGRYDLDISWGALSGQPEYISLKGVNFKTSDINGTAADWSTGRLVTVVDPLTGLPIGIYVTFMGKNATVTWGPVAQ